MRGGFSMVDNKAIHAFAIKYFNLCRNPQTQEPEVEEGFADECFALGFDMDCGKAFESSFPDSNAFNDYEALDKIIEQVNDVNLLGSAIFSQWRFVTHWAEASLLDPQYRKWFITAFSRLDVLTSDGRVYEPY
jgi:hypothetical protein